MTARWANAVVGSPQPGRFNQMPGYEEYWIFNDVGEWLMTRLAPTGIITYVWADGQYVRIKDAA